ncbi:MAG: lamin tail domain-containing protein [Bacteroidales bacterium]|nr:lamin tail domain-containing protein [Bacteroidales bacterium]
MRIPWFLLLFLPIGLTAQVVDDFSDGDFTANPAWYGMDSCFKVNGSGQLQSAATAAGTAFLSVPFEEVMGAMEWRFWIRENFSPSGNNYTDVWLVADDADLRQADRGYFLRFGAPGSNDALELYRKEGAALSLVCRGADGAIATAFKKAVRVVCDPSGRWTVATDPEGGGSYAVEAEGQDDTWPRRGHFGFLITYTASNATKFYFDEVYVGPEVLDTSPPQLVRLEVKDVSQLSLAFDEPLSATALEPGYYRVDPGVGCPDTVCFASRPSELLLSFSPPLPENTHLQLGVSGLADLAGNVMGDTLVDFAVVQASENDVVVNELMADPTPPVGLPEWEYLELYNTTGFPIDLTGWTLTVGNADKVFPQATIAPHSYLLLCKTEAVEHLAAYGATLGFPSFSLANSGALVRLRSHEGTAISEVHFADTWYRDPLKREGGWSLEQIDPLHPCAGQRNWTASDDPSGGTPGRENSVFAPNPLLPQVERVAMLGDAIVLLWFDQQMDRSSLEDPAHYRVLERDAAPVEVLIDPINAAAVSLTFGAPFQEGMVYTLLVEAVANCSGEQVAPDTRVAFGIPFQPAPAEILINEILFDPVAPAVDYVELYNASDKPFDLSELKLGVIREAFPNPPDTVMKAISEERRLFLPHRHLLLSTDGEGVARHYGQLPEERHDMASFPPYPNGGGAALLASRQGVLVDRMDYAASMHDPMLKVTKGVALERVSWTAPSCQPDNWHSAAEAVHYGTPGYANSMQAEAAFPEPDEGNARPLVVTVTPTVFSPDGDGFDDHAVIAYTLTEPGATMNAYLFDVEGRMVRHLVRGALVGKEGSVVWNGLDQRGDRVPPGVYVLVTEVFDASGRVSRCRNAVAVAAP